MGLRLLSFQWKNDVPLYIIMVNRIIKASITFLKVYVGLIHHIPTDGARANAGRRARALDNVRKGFPDPSILRHRLVHTVVF